MSDQGQRISQRPPRVGDSRRARPGAYPMVVTRPVEPGSIVMIRGSYEADYCELLAAAIADMVGHTRFLLLVSNDDTGEVVVYDAQPGVAQGQPVEPKFPA